jgi:predicted metal-dependent phosphoesterase TrpH
MNLSRLFPAVLLAAALPVTAADTDPLRTLLEASRESKQGVTVVVAGREVAMVVTEIAGDFVIGRNQQHDRIVVRVDRIDAALK